jgi:hypothetical protein
MSPKRRASDVYDPQTPFEATVLEKLNNVETIVGKLEETNKEQWKQITKNTNFISWAKGGLAVVGFAVPMVAAWFRWGG